MALKDLLDPNLFVESNELPGASQRSNIADRQLRADSASYL